MEEVKKVHITTGDPGGPLSKQLEEMKEILKEQNRNNYRRNGGKIKTDCK